MMMVLMVVVSRLHAFLSGFDEMWLGACGVRAQDKQTLTLSAGQWLVWRYQV